MKRGYADTTRGQIHYMTEGSGEPILLLHSTPRSSWEYELVVPLLAQKYQAIAMDTLGYGESDNHPYEYQMSDYARSVVEFIDAVDIREATIVGHHTGATIAAEIAVSYPKRVSSLVLSGYPLYTSEERKQLLKGTSAPIPGNAPFPVELKEDGSHLFNMWSWVKESRKPLLRSLEELQAMVMSQLKGAASRKVTFQSIWCYDARSRLS